MGLVSLLFGFSGRINRAQYWLGTISINLINYMFMFAMAGSSVMPGADKNPAAAMAAAGAQLALIGPVSLGVCWIALALQWKRFHDRGQSGWWSLLPMLPVGFMTADLFTAIAQQWPPERLLAAWGLPFLALIVISIGFFINLGCMGGNEGDNKYGPPPGSGASFNVSPSGGGGAVAASSSLFGAQSAIDRAAADQARAAAAPRMAMAPVPVAAAATAGARPSPAPGGFGRKPAR